MFEQTNLGYLEVPEMLERYYTEFGLDYTPVTPVEYVDGPKVATCCGWISAETEHYFLESEGAYTCHAVQSTSNTSAIFGSRWNQH